MAVCASGVRVRVTACGPAGWSRLNLINCLSVGVGVGV